MQTKSPSKISRLGTFNSSEPSQSQAVAEHHRPHHQAGTCRFRNRYPGHRIPPGHRNILLSYEKSTGVIKIVVIDFSFNGLLVSLESAKSLTLDRPWW